MGTNVDKIVNDIVDQLKTVVRSAVQKADAEARGELLAQFNKAIGGVKHATASTDAPVKRRPGRPRKVQTEAASTDAPKKVKAKQKRVISEEQRQKLAENLKLAREKKSADKAKVSAEPIVKRKPGRPRKVQPETAAAPAEQA